MRDVKCVTTGSRRYLAAPLAGARFADRARAAAAAKKLDTPAAGY
jgi:hypothetical protein